MNEQKDPPARRQPQGPEGGDTAGGDCYETPNVTQVMGLDARFTHRPRKERVRAYRARLAGRLGCIGWTPPPPAVVAVVDHADPVGALAEWAAHDVDCSAWTPAKR